MKAGKLILDLSSLLDSFSSYQSASTFVNSQSLKEGTILSNRGLEMFNLNATGIRYVFKTPMHPISTIDFVFAGVQGG